MPLNMIPYLAMAGVGLLGERLGRRKFRGVDPAKYRDRMMLSGADLGRLRTDLFGRLMMANQGNMQNIRQMAAAGRMPAGALSSALASANYGLARGAAAAEPALLDLQRRSVRDYLGLKNAYEQARSATEFANQQNLGYTLGTLTRLAAMWRMGMFRTPGLLNGIPPEALPEAPPLNLGMLYDMNV